MIVYLDASALVKRYVAEVESADVEVLIGEARAIGTAVVSRAEVAARYGERISMLFFRRSQQRADTWSIASRRIAWKRRTA